MALQVSQARATAAASLSSSLAVHTNHDAPRRPRVAAASAADDDADADDDEDSEDEDPQQQTIKEDGVMIPRELYATLPRAFQIGWDALSGPQQQAIIMASHRIRANNEEKEEDNDDGNRVAAAAEDEEDYDIIGRALLTERGFDSEDVDKGNCNGTTPLRYFSSRGDLTMVRYLVFRRGADCRKTDTWGRWPIFLAAVNGHLEITKLLYYHGGAHEDVRKLNKFGDSPLYIALEHEHFEVAKWLLLNGALEPPGDDIAGGGIDDEILRRDLRPMPIIGSWAYDKRLPLLLWAQDVVTDHDNFQSFFTSTSFTFNGKQLPGELELIAQFVAGTPQQLRTLRQLIDRLGVFIDDVRFVNRGEEEEDEEGE